MVGGMENIVCELKTFPDEAMWQHYGQGHSARQIGRDLGINYRTATRRLNKLGGIRPAQRSRAEGHLSLDEREEISRGIAAKLSANAIASQLGRSPSTISREIARNGGRDTYRAVDADQAAWHEALRPKNTKLAKNPQLRHDVVEGLAKKWSPEQISGRLALQHPHDPDRQISHESIYRAVYLPAKNHLGPDVQLTLRTRRRLRRPKTHRGGKQQRRGQLKDITLIADRPETVDDRLQPGHWEGDLVLGTNNSAIATLVERTSRFTEIVKLDGLTSPVVVDAVSAHMQQIPAAVRLTLTWDQGKEMAQHQRLAEETGVPIYFCDPKSPWQRGTNENTNGLIRQWFPKRITDLNNHSQTDFDQVADALNDRPRKILDYRTPAEVLGYQRRHLR